MPGSQKRIRTPLREHLRQMRYQLVPVVEDALREVRDAKGDSKDTAESDAESIPKEMEVFIEPVRAAVAAQEARVREAVMQREALDIPVPPAVAGTGQVVAIYRRPGQAVRAGELVDITFRPAT